MASVIHVLNQTVVVSPYAELLGAIGERGLTCRTTMLDEMIDAAQSKYHEAMPEFAAYTLDIKGIKAWCETKGFSKHSDHHQRAYAEAVTLKYGATPVSSDSESSALRVKRITEAGLIDKYNTAFEKAKAEGKPLHACQAIATKLTRVTRRATKQDKPGAPAGETKEQKINAGETIEQWVTRLTIPLVLDTVAKILFTDKSTRACAVELTAMITHYVEAATPAAAAEPAKRTGTA